MLIYFHKKIILNEIFVIFILMQSSLSLEIKI